MDGSLLLPLRYYHIYVVHYNCNSRIEKQLFSKQFRKILFFFVCPKVALKLIPNNNTFINVLAAKDETHQMVQDDIRSLISLLIPLLSQLHSILVRVFLFQ